MSPALFEQHVLSKPYFDRMGLILALEGEIPLGFVHVGFGANSNLSDVSLDSGVLSRLMVRTNHFEDEKAREEVANALLLSAEDYAKSKGARRMFGGGTFPKNPFYLGFYGGSRLPGILCEDEFTLQILKNADYQESGQFRIWQSSLGGFRTIINRRQMQLRRQYNIHATFDPAPRSWWEACTLGNAERVRFELVDRSQDNLCGTVTFWNMQPMASHWGVQTSGMFDLQIDSSLRRAGLATFLVGESIRQLKDHGSTVVEIQTESHDDASAGLLQKLGISQIDSGIQLEKEL
ncbi:GNAT family N-acetyltransferase [Mariniblastus sp.]|nr:GNAT family N-acetyltransferase [Mariniblastus sp.]MDB4755846.1 GNAT family N-acetyltransferase [Mariniblastus sp.]